jgi:hypothetical protein
VEAVVVVDAAAVDGATRTMTVLKTRVVARDGNVDVAREAAKGTEAVAATTTAADTTPSDEEVTAFLNKWIDKIDLQERLVNYVIRTETVACTVAELDWTHVFGETLTRVAKSPWRQHQIREAAFVLVRDELPLEHNADRIEGALTWEQVMDRVNA